MPLRRGREAWGRGQHRTGLGAEQSARGLGKGLGLGVAGCADVLGALSKPRSACGSVALGSVAGPRGPRTENVRMGTVTEGLTAGGGLTLSLGLSS